MACLLFLGRKACDPRGIHRFFNPSLRAEDGAMFRMTPRALCVCGATFRMTPKPAFWIYVCDVPHPEL